MVIRTMTTNRLKLIEKIRYFITNNRNFFLFTKAINSEITSEWTKVSLIQLHIGRKKKKILGRSFSYHLLDSPDMCFFVWHNMWNIWT